MAINSRYSAETEYQNPQVVRYQNSNNVFEMAIIGVLLPTYSIPS